MVVVVEGVETNIEGAMKATKELARSIGGNVVDLGEGVGSIYFGMVSKMTTVKEGEVTQGVVPVFDGGGGRVEGVVDKCVGFVGVVEVESGVVVEVEVEVTCEEGGGNGIGGNGESDVGDGVVLLVGGFVGVKVGVNELEVPIYAPALQRADITWFDLLSFEIFEVARESFF